MTPGETVRAFIDRLNHKDFDGALALLAPDFVWHNVAMDPPADIIHGGEGMAHRLKAVFQFCDKVDWRILEQAENGDTVLHERSDDHYFRPGIFPKSDVLKAPLASVWKVRDGKITLWRDYFDLRDFEKQTGMSIPDFGRMIGRNYGQDGT